ncbi:MAG TPA: Crp/Fnr family transcriptional regulator [Flavobacteriales bacterium]|mgnify:CR=1 FL=1|nr:Crp/Fnr family transcriptional regulator [Flavobacteriales bacterium]HMR26118.1 Crp/Fnr family transcriptional regulator [Flavobacteriales bacterium]
MEAGEPVRDHAGLAAARAQLRAFTQRIVEVDDAVMDRLMSALVPATLAKGGVLLQDGEVCEHVWFIGRGLVRAYFLKDGEEITQQFFFEGSYTTDYESFLTRRPTQLHLEALEPTLLLALHREAMQRLYAADPGAERMGRRIAEEIFLSVSRRNRSFLLDSAEQRYLDLMRERPKVMQRVPQRHIASYLGVKPESLSRIRARVARGGR